MKSVYSLPTRRNVHSPLLLPGCFGHAVQTGLADTLLFGFSLPILLDSLFGSDSWLYPVAPVWGCEQTIATPDAVPARCVLIPHRWLVGKKVALHVESGARWSQWDSVYWCASCPDSSAWLFWFGMLVHVWKCCRYCFANSWYCVLLRELFSGTSVWCSSHSSLCVIVSFLSDNNPSARAGIRCFRQLWLCRFLRWLQVAFQRNRENARPAPRSCHFGESLLFQLIF